MWSCATRLIVFRLVFSHNQLSHILLTTSQQTVINSENGTYICLFTFFVKRWKLFFFGKILDRSTFIVYRTRAIITRSWILTIHKDRIFWKNFLDNKEMFFKNRVKNIDAAAYNGACSTVHNIVGQIFFHFQLFY